MQFYSQFLTCQCYHTLLILVSIALLSFATWSASKTERVGSWNQEFMPADYKIYSCFIPLFSDSYSRKTVSEERTLL